MQANLENRVSLDRLEPGRHVWEYELTDAFFSGLEWTEVLSGNVHAVARLDLRESDYSLTIALRGRVQLTCDRCLDPMDWDIVCEEEVEPETESKELDLNWLAYELIAVNLPLVHRHPEGGCNPEMAALLQNHLCSMSEDPDDGDKDNME